MITPDRVSIGWNVGTQPPIRRVRMMTRLARGLRYDAVWTVDHFLGFFPQHLWDRDLTFLADPAGTPHAFFDWQALLGDLAGRAGRMQIAIGVTEAVRRHPVLLAQTAMTLAHLAKAPPIIGVGAGEAENIEPYGLDFSKPVARMEEALQIIRRCFDARGPFDFEGRHYRLDRAMMDLSPPPDRVPQLWIAAHGPRMLRLTGEYGDGWWPTLLYTPQSYADALGVIRMAALAAGRDPMAIVPGWSIPVVLGRTEAAARRILDSRLVRFLALLVPAQVWRDHGVAHPLGDTFGGMVEFVPTRYGRPELEAAMAAVDVNLAERAVLWGTPRSVHTRLRDFIDAGLRHLTIAPVSALASRSDAAFSIRATVAMQRRLRSEGV